MTLSDFRHLGSYVVPMGIVLYRVQYIDVRSTTVKRGPLKMYGGLALGVAPGCE